jgi:hypothetical protein
MVRKPPSGVPPALQDAASYFLDQLKKALPQHPWAVHGATVLGCTVRGFQHYHRIHDILLKF